MTKSLLCAVAAALVVGSCGGSSGTDSAAGLTPVSAEPVAQTSRLFYDVSPDGRWMSWTDQTDGACLQELGGEVPVCADLGDLRTDQMAWSPDSTRVVVLPDALRAGESGPITVIGIDGARTDIAEPDPNDERGRRGAVSASFIDDDTIVYYAIAADPLEAEFWTIDIDGSNHELLAAYPGELSDGSSALPGRWIVVADDAVYGTVGGRPTDAVGFSLSDGEINVVAAGDDETQTSPHVTQVLGDTILLGDINRLGDFGVQSRTGGLWTIVDGDRTVVVPDRGFYRTRSVRLSPTGSHVAILESYNGETLEGETDPDNLGDDLLQRSRISIATTASVLNGNPEWSDLSGFSWSSGSADYDGLNTNIIWVDDTNIVLELEEDIVAIALEPAS